jgi:hypothetical protein
VGCAESGRAIDDPKGQEALFLDAFAEQVEEVSMAAYREELNREPD